MDDAIERVNEGVIDLDKMNETKNESLLGKRFYDEMQF